MTTTTACPHVTDTAAAPSGDRCEECGSKVNLRVCTECGHVGCCESQQGHNTAHARAAGHPIIRSLPLGPGSFTWCYECDRYVAS
ncbi:MAG TPA: UBP-type zinc finger domain-containing protein [Actinomycetota bacterium]|nr:UBP-type zinc finger domain-containing protein [Actinomycetota bacterium]